MKKVLFAMAMIITMICTVSCETVGKGPSAEIVYES